MRGLRQGLSRYLRRHPVRPRVQILSDLHLEVGKQYVSFEFPVSAALLLLAGDIGRLIDYDEYLAFLAKQASRYETVLLVLGNHEFYGLSHSSGIDTAERLVNEPSLQKRVVLLNQARWDSPDSDLSVLGCTLWSWIPPEAYDSIKSKVRDFTKISGWSPELHNEAHAREVTWLREQLALVVQDGPEERRVLVVTHHAPCTNGTSDPKHVNNPWTSAFATDLLTRKDWSVVKAWVFGHTHYCADFVHDGIRVVANQRGYVLPGAGQLKAGPAKDTDAKGFHPGKTIAL